MANEGPTTLPVPQAKGDISITALYTSGVWSWAGFSGAELLASKDGRRLFKLVNAVLGVGRLFRRRSPALRYTLLHRHAIIDHLVSASGPKQVLEVAAGLSRRGVAFSADPALSYVEVDLAAVVATKRALLERSEEGRAVLARPNFTLEVGDAREPLERFVRVEGGPLTVVMEGLMIYLEQPERVALWERVVGLLGSFGGCFVFDLVPPAEEPKPGFFGRLLGWIFRRSTKGGSFAKGRITREELVASLRAVGFGQVDVYEASSPPPGLTLPSPDAPSKIVVFRCALSP